MYFVVILGPSSRTLKYDTRHEAEVMFDRVRISEPDAEIYLASEVPIMTDEELDAAIERGEIG